MNKSQRSLIVNIKFTSGEKGFSHNSGAIAKTKKSVPVNSVVVEAKKE